MGPERAAIMMELLPPVGWGEIATKTDLMVLEGRLRGEIAELRGEVRGEIAGLRGEMAELRGEMAELRGEMSELSGELRDEMGKLRSEMGQLSLAQANGLRSLFLAMVATNATTVGLVFAAVRFGST